MSIEETEQISLKFNQKAMDSLESNNFNSALSLLHQALYLLKNKKLTEPVVRLRCITLNNLGCVYKRLERMTKALFYLNEALSLGQKFASEVDLAGIHLNISAIKSLLSAHEDALFHALQGLKISLKLLQTEAKHINTVLSGYFQTGFEYFFLHKNKEALKYLRNGHELACSSLGKNHMISQKFFKALHEKGLKDEENIKAKKGKSKVVLRPIETERVQTKSTEPMKMHRMRRENHSVSSSPLGKISGKSKKSGSLQQTQGHNIKYIGNTFNAMQKILEKHGSRQSRLGKIQSDTGSSLSVPSNMGKNKYKAAVIIQKNLRMWKCRKKYKKILKCVKTIQKAYRDHRYFLYLSKVKNRFSSFSQQFNQKILHQNRIELQEKMVSHKTQTKSKKATGVKISYFAPCKFGSFHYKIVLIQKHIKGFLMRKRLIKRKLSLLLIQKTVKMYLKKKVFSKYLNEKKFNLHKARSIILIQRNMKMALAYKKFSKFKRGIQKIQLLFRKSKPKPELKLLDDITIKSKRAWT